MFLRAYIKGYRPSFILDVFGNMFNFETGGDGPPRYNVMNLQKYKNNNYKWKIIGTYSGKRLTSPTKLINIFF